MNLIPSTGFDGVLHMAEEVKNPTIAVPQTMVLGIVINGIMTFGFLIGVLFTMGSYETALETTTKYPIIEIFLQATKSVRAATAMTSLLILIGFIALFGSLASTTRLTWAFARDKGLPFADFFSYVGGISFIRVYVSLLTGFRYPLGAKFPCGHCSL